MKRVPNQLECSFCGGTYRVCRTNGKLYCAKHRHHIYRYGKIREFTTRTPNVFIKRKGYSVIVLRDKDGKIVAESKIDNEDVERVASRKWCFGSTTHYAISGSARGQDMIRLHNFILNDIGVDHINRDKLDNRKKNLRICSQQENTFNSTISKNNTSGVVGVSLHKQTKKWRAYIFINRKQKALGLFKTKKEATQKRQEAEVKYFGKFRVKNNCKK